MTFYQLSLVFLWRILLFFCLWNLPLPIFLYVVSGEDLFAKISEMYQMFQGLPGRIRDCDKWGVRIYIFYYKSDGNTLFWFVDWRVIITLFSRTAGSSEQGNNVSCMLSNHMSQLTLWHLLKPRVLSPWIRSSVPNQIIIKARGVCPWISSSLPNHMCNKTVTN